MDILLLIMLACLMPLSKGEHKHKREREREHKYERLPYMSPVLPTWNFS